MNEQTSARPTPIFIAHLLLKPLSPYMWKGFALKEDKTAPGGFVVVESHLSSSLEWSRIDMGVGRKGKTYREVCPNGFALYDLGEFEVDINDEKSIAEWHRQLMQSLKSKIAEIESGVAVPIED